MKTFVMNVTHQSQGHIIKNQVVYAPKIDKAITFSFAYAVEQFAAKKIETVNQSESCSLIHFENDSNKMEIWIEEVQPINLMEKARE